MKHVKIEAFNVADAWFKALEAIWYQGEIFNVGHGSEETDTKKLDVTIHIAHPEQTPYANDSNPTTNDEHIQAYALEYLILSCKGEHPYTYGSRLRDIIDQIEELIKAAIENPANRQLTMTIRIPEDIIPYRYIDEEIDFLPVKKKVKHEPPCLTCIDIEILNGKVNMTCYFRSWDAYGALNENIGGLYLLLKYIVDEINQRGNKNYTTGGMILHSKNCHIYQRCYIFVKQLLKIDEKSEEERKKRKAYVVKRDKTKYGEYVCCPDSCDCMQEDICRANLLKCVMDEKDKPKLPEPNPPCSKGFSECSESDICGGYCSSEHPKYSKSKV